jgi:hypothetical protein
MGTGSNDIRPFVLATQVAWDDVVDGQVGGMAAAVLAGEIIPAEHFPAGQLDADSRTGNHFFQPDDGRQGVTARDRFYLAPAVQDKRSLL